MEYFLWLFAGYFVVFVIWRAIKPGIRNIQEGEKLTREIQIKQKIRMDIDEIEKEIEAKTEFDRVFDETLKPKSKDGKQ